MWEVYSQGSRYIRESEKVEMEICESVVKSGKKKCWIGTRANIKKLKERCKEDM